MDEEQGVIEQLISSNVKMWSSSTLKNFNNYSIIVANNCDNIKYHECGAVGSVTDFWVTSTGCRGEFQIVFKHFEGLKNLTLNISCLIGSGCLETG